MDSINKVGIVVVVPLRTVMEIIKSFRDYLFTRLHYGIIVVNCSKVDDDLFREYYRY